MDRRYYWLAGVAAGAAVLLGAALMAPPDGWRSAAVWVLAAIWAGCCGALAWKAGR